MKKVSVTAGVSMSPRIENWLMNRNIDYEVAAVRMSKGIRLKIVAEFPSDDRGKHQAGLYERFLERLKKEEKHNAKLG